MNDKRHSILIPRLGNLLKSVIVISIFLFTSPAILAEGGNQSNGKLKFDEDVDTPLFQNDDPLEIIIQTDIEKILTDKSEDPEYQPAVLVQRLDGQSICLFDIKVKPRGKSRRNSEICSFPPLKLNFKKGQTANTVFVGQDKLKLVTHCGDDQTFPDLVLREYLAYKTYNLLTDYSYKVRLVRVTYQDTESKYPETSQYGFLIEHDKQVAQRLDSKIYKESIVHQDSCEDQSLKIFALFQYMIGNTDWWIHTGHNVTVVETSDQGLVPVPYDFDMSGVVDAPYAVPSHKLPIQTVRQRFYKGPVSVEDEMTATIDLFNNKLEGINDLCQNFTLLKTGEIKAILKYYEKFYKAINNSQDSTKAMFYEADWTKQYYSRKAK